MKLQITHQTNYYYDDLAQRSVQYIRMTPMRLKHQTIHHWSVMLPKVAHSQVDGFGNEWLTLSRNEAHNNLQMQASGLIEVRTDTTCLEDSEIVPYMLFTVPTPLTACDDAMWEFAQPYLANVQPNLAAMEQLKVFAKALLDTMPYTKQVTHVGTTAAEAFAIQGGVCQDHTHVFLACVRAAGLPARYVSGYLYEESANHMASHAWAEVWLDHAWYTFDISNQYFQPKTHVYVAIGRDYLDAAPVRGVRVGGGYESLYSQVMVMRQD